MTNCEILGFILKLNDLYKENENASKEAKKEKHKSLVELIKPIYSDFNEIHLEYVNELKNVKKQCHNNIGNLINIISDLQNKKSLKEEERRIIRESIDLLIIRGLEPEVESFLVSIKNYFQPFSYYCPFRDLTNMVITSSLPKQNISKLKNFSPFGGIIDVLSYFESINYDPEKTKIELDDIFEKIINSLEESRKTVNSNYIKILI
jgi:hypothetical protein